jgi:opacity protein-like surface antigen
MLKRCAITLAALALLLLPASARADWLFTPNIGTTFGGAADGREHLTYGASIGWMGAGIVGWEADFQYTPEFFEPNDTDVDFFGSSNVFTVMGNVIVGIPVGGQSGGGIRPFGIFGVGLIQQNTDADEAFDVDSNEFGFNVGGGLMGFFNDNVGLRGDIRYVRSFEEADDNLVTIGIGDFDFWRANVGVVFRW